MKRRNFILMAGAAALMPHPVSAQEKKERPKFDPLFNGKDLTGWSVVETKEGAWRVENGALVIDKAGGGWLRTEKEYKDFVLKLEFKLSPGGNSGVFLRAPAHGNGAYEGLEIQVLDHFHEMYKDIKPGQFTGSVYDVVPARDHKALKPVGEWNSYRIRYQGSKIKVFLNEVIEVDDDLEKYNDRLKEHPGLARKSGYIGLQSHDSRVEFRNIQIRELKGI